MNVTPLPSIERQTQPILISYLSGDMVHADFTYSLAMMLMYSITIPRIWCGLNNTRTSVIDHGRNVAAELLQEANASHLFFLDSDMEFPHETLHRLYGHDLDIVGATYCQRRPRHAMTHRNLDHSSVMPPNNPLDPLHEVESLGSGCILIKASVFAALEQPYYTSDWLDKKQPQGEDRGFCLKARAAGFKVWCDIPLSYEMGHCGTKIFRASDVDYVLTGEES